jgi:hypothetical protein
VSCGDSTYTSAPIEKRRKTLRQLSHNKIQDMAGQGGLREPRGPPRTQTRAPKSGAKPGAKAGAQQDPDKEMDRTHAPPNVTATIAAQWGMGACEPHVTTESSVGGFGRGGMSTNQSVRKHRWNDKQAAAIKRRRAWAACCRRKVSAGK